MSERDQFDTLLDEALTSYAEPCAGLEERVVRRAKSAARRRRITWSAVPLAAALGVAVLLMMPSRKGEIASGGSAPLSHGRSASHAVPAVFHAMVARRRRVRHNTAETDALLGVRTPLPIFVKPDAQERALRAALTQPGFLAALEAAQPPKDWDKDPDATNNEAAAAETRP